MRANWPCGVVLSLFLAPMVWAQAPASANPSAVSPAAAAEVPRLIKFSGTLLDAQDRPLAGPVGVTFALHAQQTGGAALWLETQNVTPDAHGNYTVLLGANSANGVPAELFASGEARWLEVQVERQAEQPRILLVSVPYALKAKDAETLGGKPASAFLTTETLAGNSAGAAAAASTPSTTSTGLPKSIATTPRNAASPQAATPCSSVTSDGTATVNSIALFTTACKIQSSLMTQAVVNGFPGVNLVGNNAGLLLSGTGTHEVTVTGSTSSGRLGQDSQGFFFASDTPGKVIKFDTNNNGTLTEWMRITSAGNVGIGTTTPGAKLEIAGGNLALPNTTSASVGVLTMGGTSFLHNFGNQNTFVGDSAGNMSTTGHGNTGVGNGALFSSTTGGLDSAFGLDALLHNTTGGDNSAFGLNALAFNTTGGLNSALGAGALQSNSTGNNNTAIGFQAGVTANGFNGNISGSNNTFIGFNAGPGTSTQLTNATAIGENALVSCNNCMALGGTGPDAVNVGIGTTSPDNLLTVNGTADKPGGGFWSAFSDGRLKNVRGSFDSGLKQVLQLHPIRYQYKERNALGIHDSEEHIGVVAQDVARVLPEAVSANSQGYLLVNDEPILWSMLNAIKEQQQEIRGQQKRIRELTGEVGRLRKVKQAVTQLEARLARIESQETAAQTAVSSAKAGDRNGSSTRQGR